jgi:hypothetical protein
MKAFIDSICEKLSCRLNDTDKMCRYRQGAETGTVCGSGQVCYEGKCSFNKNAPKDDCLFGDEIILGSSFGLETPTEQMNCSSLFKWLIDTDHPNDPKYFCQNFRNRCCNACKSKLSLFLVMKIRFKLKILNIN